MQRNPTILDSMKTRILLVMTFLLPAVFLAVPAQSEVPFAPGWTEAQEPQVFPKGRLYDYIDGGAELYEEFGVIKLTVCQYQKEQDELELLVYDMESPDAALGIYLMQAGTERPIAGIVARNSGSSSQVNAVRGKSFIQITSLSSSPAMQEPTIALCNQVMAAVPEGKPVSLLTMLPRDRLVAGSERLVHGPLAVRQVMRVFRANPLELGGSIWGAAAKYRIGTGAVETRLQVTYADTSAARTVFANLEQVVDSSFSLKASSTASRTFEDRTGNRLTAVIDGKHLILAYRSGTAIEN
ncbi:hypothetical protein C3F09_02580 [candidate division GN15 bacterium]|uniref:Uncharacterized protein n=1 Tax=candidate division GN15 bacterium TaxID=2072418 RepID=A0A855X3L7_9BACT|nr:MAG: hypothetical protein C3F09_02580 [candidate division GN15 bacterium]